MNPIRYHDDVEVPVENEAEISQRIVERMAATQAENADRHRHAHRDAHAKSHAIITGQLTVHDDLPHELAQGIFATPGTHEVVARLSSAPGDIHSDEIPAPRGFALKIIGVEGERLSPDLGGANQDFLMVNFPTLAFGTVTKYEDMLDILEKNASNPAAAQKAVSAAARGISADLAPVHRPRPEGDQREAQNAADDRLAGRDRHAAHRGHDQKAAGTEQCGEHADDQRVRVVGDDLWVDEPAADGFGHLAAGQPGAEELENAGDDHRLTQRDGAGTHRRAHGVGDVVGADAPGHEEAEDARQNDEQVGVLRDDRHEAGGRRGAERAG